MLKLIRGFVFAGLLLCCLFFSALSYADSFNWLSSDLSFRKGIDVAATPTSLNNNIGCQKQDISNCSIPVTYGAATQNGTVRLNGTNSFLPVISYIDNRQHFLPIPNSSTFMTYTTEPPYGFYLYFNYNFTSSVAKTVNTGSQYQVIKAPEGKLVDKANHRLAADYTSMNFSQNGQWMIVSEPNVAMLRVNLQTFEVVPFASGFNYTIGIDPAIRTAITNDGRYAVVSSQGFNTFKVYDLSTCSAVPDTINGPVSCRSRDLQPFLGQQLPGYSFSGNLKFITNTSISAYATYFVGPSRKTAFVAIGDGSQSKIQLLGMGESYISGEGAFDYQSGTDESDNKCHLSLISYPYLAGHDLGYDSYHSIACSGALTSDITNSSDQYKGQAQNRTIKRSLRSEEEIDSIFASFKPGYINQSDFVSRYQPQTILISIGGNDIGFSKIVTKCGVPWELTTCYSSYEDRLELVREINNNLFPKLVGTYQTIKNSGAPDARIYVVGYPQIAKQGGDCALNVHLRDAEVDFSGQLISYLDSVIQLAAAKAGVYYVDTQDALDGHRLCEAKGGSVAVNGLTLGNDLPTQLGPIGNESYHPNDLGHQLLENKILAATNNLTNPMPAANLNIIPPSENGLEILNVVKSGRTVYPLQHDDGISDNAMFVGAPSAINVRGAEHSLKPSTSYRLELHSQPVVLGNYSTDANGDLVAQVTIPQGASPGVHTLHIYGPNIAGDTIDIYKNIYIGASAEDYDGDGIPNSNDPCQFISPSSQDYDKDGINDACDGQIGDAPAEPSPETAPVAEQDQDQQPSSQNADSEHAATRADNSDQSQNHSSASPSSTTKVASSSIISNYSNIESLFFEPNPKEAIQENAPKNRGSSPKVLAAQASNESQKSKGLLVPILILLGVLGGLVYGLVKFRG